jgi:hypothetical protein
MPITVAVQVQRQLLLRMATLHLVITLPLPRSDLQVIYVRHPAEQVPSYCCDAKIVGVKSFAVQKMVQFHTCRLAGFFNEVASQVNGNDITERVTSRLACSRLVSFLLRRISGTKEYNNYIGRVSFQ